MAHYDPETLIILRRVLDEAWELCRMVPNLKPLNLRWLSTS